MCDVKIQDGGKTPILKKDLARIFSSQLWRQSGCHGIRGTIIGTNWKIDGNICLKFSQLASCSSSFHRWVFGQIREKTWLENFRHDDSKMEFKISYT